MENSEAIEVHGEEAPPSKELVLRRVRQAEGEFIEAMPMPGEDIIVFARTPAEMAAAQERIIDWSRHQVAYRERQLAMAQENLAAAKEAKIKTAPWKTLVRQAERRLTYYQKLQGAAEAGYAIVPDFPINVVAVRTKKKKPTDAGTAHRHASSVKEEKPQELAIGEGEYVDPTPQHYESMETVERTKYGTNEKEMVREKRFTTCDEFDEIDFPLRIVRPQVIRSFSEALKHKIFDKIGVLPNNRRNVDPMIVGTIEMKEGSHIKSLSFLISWWIPTQSL